MADLMLAWDATNGVADLVLAGGDLVLDQSLQTAVLVSLGTDRLAEVDDELPDNSGDRRGWVGDVITAGGTVDLIGSRLWLLNRAKQIPETARRAEIYALEALAWMTEDGVADSVTALCTFPRQFWGQLQIAINQGNASPTFNYLWQMSA